MPISGAVPTVTRRGRVLIVDDEPYVARALAIFLSGEHEVTTETTAAAALERLRAGEDFDVVLCDLMMPDMTGMDLYETLRATLQAPTSHGPSASSDEAPHEELTDRIVFITGGAYTERARAFLASVQNETLDKPPDPFALRALVRRRVHERCMQELQALPAADGEHGAVGGRGGA